MFDKFRAARPGPPPPEADWIVAMECGSIRVVDPDGGSLAVGKSELSRVAIETNDGGPWGADVWWLMFGAGGVPACAFPLGATGETEAVDYLTALPGFDHEEMVKAMSSTGNRLFAVWSR